MSNSVETSLAEDFAKLIHSSRCVLAYLGPEKFIESLQLRFELALAADLDEDPELVKHRIDVTKKLIEQTANMYYEQIIVKEVKDFFDSIGNQPI
jgi:hypothetical protein